MSADPDHGFAAAMAGLRPDDGIADFARMALKNVIACAGAAATGAQADRLAAVAEGQGVPLIGRASGADPLWAAWFNAAVFNLQDYDDTHFPTILHPTSPVAGAVLSAALTRGVTGRAILEALAVGMEAACRVALAISPGHYARGWHITSTAGAIGAAVGAGHALRLTPAQMEGAIAGGAARAGGFVGALGTAAKALSVGGAARDGLLAAMLAERGMAGQAGPLNGRFGFLQVMTGASLPADAPLWSEIGRRWDLRATVFKPYPVGVVLNPVVDAALALRADLASPEAIRRIIVTGSRLLCDRADRPGVATGNMAQVSAQHAVAVALIDGRAGPAEFTDAAVARADVRELAARVEVAEAEGFAETSAAVALILSDGRRLERRVDAARGTLARPLDDGDIDAKLAEAWGGAAPALIAAVDGLAAAKDGRALMRALMQPAPGLGRELPERMKA